jgi:hypothetical protein
VRSQRLDTQARQDHVIDGQAIYPVAGEEQGAASAVIAIHSSSACTALVVTRIPGRGCRASSARAGGLASLALLHRIS